MPKFFKQAALLVFIFLSGYSVYAQNNFWSDRSDVRAGSTENQRKVFPLKFRSLTLDTAGLISFLKTTPKEFTEAARNNPVIVMLPMPDGSYNRFAVVETAIMDVSLAAQFPTIKTYGGQGIDDPYATVKIDWSPLGLHAMVLSPVHGSVLIDPSATDALTKYISYYKKDFTSVRRFIENGKLLNPEELHKSSRAQRTAAGQCIGTTLRTYRLAVACTGEYARAIGFGAAVTTAQALSAIVTTINRVNGIYETEVDIRLLLVSTNRKIVFTNPATDPFEGNSNPNTLIEESQQIITDSIGAPNFDIGHTFSTNGGGLAEVGAVCKNNVKASGVTGIDPPVGDPYDVDYVAHEVGHQFGANHTFNATTGDCSGQGDITANAEPGSGSTIMGYAGICEQNNLQSNTDPYFHALSFDEITTYINSGEGNNCGTSIATGNHPPVVNAGANYFIPKSTPFVLTGSATDVDGDALTYNWEQINTGAPSGDWNNPSGDAPIFRSFRPGPVPVRYFPKIDDVIKNTTTIGELLPSYGRTLNFRLTARDNRAGGGGICFGETSLTVNDQAGPFVVTSPNTDTLWRTGTFKTITWDVARTNVPPVNSANVAIELSVDGGLTFPIQIRTNTPNDGSEEIIVPGNTTQTARIRVKSIGNVFYDISNANFQIQASTQSEFIFNNPADVYSCPGNTRRAVIKTSSLNNFSTPITLSASGNPAGSTVVFSANPINPGTNDSITLAGSVTPGVYNITITGTAGQVVKSSVIKFIIGAPALSPATLPLNPADYSLLPTFSWQPTPGAVTYTLEISKNNNFSTTEQSIPNITGTTYKLNTPLAENTEYFWRVSGANTCGAGPSSTPVLFKTAAITCADTVFSTNVPGNIPDSISIISSTLEIASGGIISDVDVVGLKGTHGFFSDLTIRIESPANTSVELFSGQCNDQQEFDISFDDEAESLDFPCPPSEGLTVRPSQPLAAFKDENSTGTWTLKISDDFDGDGGSLTNWGLRICTYSTATLPVTWLTFTGQKNDKNSVTLKWSTVNEINNKYYEIERSTDGFTFISIYKINAGNTPGMVEQYLYNDAKAVAGLNYYRLKQVDDDGRHSYSHIVRVLIDKQGMQYMVYPNPATNKSTLRILTEMKQVIIRLNDVSGKTISQKWLGKVTTGQEFSIPVQGLSKGLYTLTVMSEEGISTSKLIVQ